MLAILPTTVVHAATKFVVDWNADTSGGKSTCPSGNPANPTCDLRTAIADAVSDDTITFAPGIGTIHLTGSPAPTFGPIILGTNKDLTIDGAGSGVAITADAETQLFVINNPAKVAFLNLTLQGVSISSGNSGGAVSSLSDQPLTFTNVSFLNNTVNNGGSGGAIDMEPSIPGPGTPSAPLTLINCTFIGNHADAAGGAIHAKSAITIMNSTFVGNSSNGNANGSDGGAIFDADASGPFPVGTITAMDSTFSTNQNAGGSGGAIATNNLIATRVTFNNNRAANQGGAVVFEGGTTNSTMTNVTFTGNTAVTEGGAILAAGHVTLTNVTISGNSGGINQTGASVGGGGISNIDASNPITLTNTIIAGNTFLNQLPPDVNGAFTSGGNNLIGIMDGSTGLTNNVNGDIVGTGAGPIDAKLGPLGGNGGTTQTMPLLAASPAIGAGKPGACASAPVSGTDQRGSPRLASICDIGAYESQGKKLVATVNPLTATSGTAFPLTVIMEDTFGDVLTRYTGTVHFTSDDTHAVLPPDYQFTTGGGNDNGQHAFPVTLNTPGVHSVTVTDTLSAGLMATQGNIVVGAGAPATITVNANTTPQSTLVGTNFSVPLSVTVRDAGNNPVANAVVTFTPPASGASGSFVGGVNTATTNASGIATAASFTANTIPGTFTVNATAGGVGSPAAFTLTNTPPGIVVTVTTLPVGTVNHPYSVTLTASGGTGPYSFAVTAGSLPPGLNLSTGGMLSGTPTSAGQTTFTVTATDANGSTGSQSYTLAVGATNLTSLIIVAPQSSVRVGETVPVRVIGGFSDGSTEDLTASVQWTSSDTTKATIDAQGNIRGISPGSVTITATANALSATAPITIPAPSATGIAPAAAPAGRPGSATSGGTGPVPPSPGAPGRPMPTGPGGGPTPNPLPSR
jgi:predicted outer membrane repeat protein